jgi:hypothetical protein
MTIGVEGGYYPTVQQYRYAFVLRQGERHRYSWLVGTLRDYHRLFFGAFFHFLLIGELQ